MQLLKPFFFMAVLPGSLTKTEEKSLDGSYTRILRKVVNIRALDKMRSEDLYGDLPTIFKVIKTKNFKLACQVIRGKTPSAYLTVTWDPPHGKMIKPTISLHKLISTRVRVSKGVQIIICRFVKAIIMCSSNCGGQKSINLQDIDLKSIHVTFSCPSRSFDKLNEYHCQSFLLCTI